MITTSQYQDYKDSGIEWIGEIPKHWELKRLKYISEIIPSNVDKHIYEDEIQVELCNYTDVYKNDTIDSNTILSKGSCNSSEYDKYHVKLHDVIITKDSESPDDIGIPCLISERLQNVICGYHLTILRPTSVDGRYLFRYLLSNFTKSYFCVSSNGMTRYGLGKSSTEDLFTTLPPLSEQEQIVSYLDEKTSLIDEMVEKKKRKIELLKEYRTSLINTVVTKGLNPDVPMKDSGIEWIGEIPRHWELKRLKHIRSKDKFSLVDGPFGSNLKSEHYIEDGDVYVIESGFITSGKFRYVRQFKTISLDHFETIKRSQSFEGCIIMSKIGEYYGMSGVLPKLNKPTVISGNCISIKLDDDINKFYIHHTLIQHWNNGTFKKEVQQTGQPFISMTMVDNISFPLPPITEQEQIVTYLDEKTSEIDKTIELENKKIELLKEYRQSLISKVVTGKIKVVSE